MPTIRIAWCRHRGMVLAGLLGLAASAILVKVLPNRPRAAWTTTRMGRIAFTPDGRSLLTSGLEGMRLQDAATGRDRLVFTEKVDGIWQPSQDDITALKFSEDGRTLIGRVSDSQDYDHFVLKVWDLVTGRCRVAFDLDDGSGDDKWGDEVGGGAVISANGLRVAVARDSPEQQTRTEVWDVGEPKRLATFPDSTPLALSRDGDAVAIWELMELAASGKARSISRLSVRDVSTGRMRWARDFDPKEDNQLAVRFSPDGKTLAVRENLEVRLWDLASARERTTTALEGGEAPPLVQPGWELAFPRRSARIRVSL